MLKFLTQRPSKRTLLLTVLSVTALVGFVPASRFVCQKLSDQPITPAQAKKQIWACLKAETGQHKFRTTLPSFTNGLAAVPPILVTNKSGKVKARKGETINTPTEMLRDFREAMTAASDYGSIYRLLGEALTAAEQFLASTNLAHREAGLRLAMEAHRAAQTDASDAWLAARIVEAYLWPNLGVAEAQRIKKLDVDTVLSLADRTFREVGETNNIIRNYELIIRNQPQTARADKARQRLARLYEEQRRYKDALRCWREIQRSDNPAIQQRITLLEQQLKRR